MAVTPAFAAVSVTAPSAAEPAPTNRNATGVATLAPLPESARPDTNVVAQVWDRFPRAVEAPGTVHVTTNASGMTVHSFSMHPVVTNMAALTNDVSAAERQQAAIEAEVKDLMQREVAVKRATMDDHKAMVAIATNFVPADAEGKQLKQRMTELVTELKVLGAKYEKLQEADPVLKKAKDKVDADNKELKEMQDRIKDLRGQQNALNVQIWQARELTVKKDESKGAAKASGQSVPAPAP